MKFFKTNAKLNAKDNFLYVLRDKEGNIKPLFQSNRFGQWLINKGILNAKSALTKIPFIMGNWANQMRVANLITSAGLAGIASRINGAGSEAAFTYIAIGTGTGAAAAGDTALGTEITTAGGQRASATATRTTTTVSNDTARLVLTFNFTDTFAVTEAGALNAASSGVLLNRQVFTAVNVANGDSLQITIDVANANA